jgi:hypothetical protein
MHQRYKIRGYDLKTSSLTPLVADVLKKISDDKTLILFNSIAVSNGDRYIHFREMSLTPKQYYSRISGLLAATYDLGLVGSR